jgi:purine/pyrimidine-nucleoside phosphorylase
LREARWQPITIIMSSPPAQFDSVTIATKANVYFDGNVVSHTVLFNDGSKKTLGLIRPGSFRFKTEAPERMEIIAGTCRVTIGAGAAEQEHGAGSHFDVPGNSGFTIEVKEGLCEYICSFLRH